jgi:hypothetical protein
VAVTQSSFLVRFGERKQGLRLIFVLSGGRGLRKACSGRTLNSSKRRNSRGLFSPPGGTGSDCGPVRGSS